MIVTKLVILFSFAIFGQCAIYTHRNNYLETKTLRRLNLNEHRDQVYLNRLRRASSPTTNATVVSGTMHYNNFVLNGTDNCTQAYVHWSGKGKSEGVFVLTLQLNPFNGSVMESKTWKSTDYGKSFEEYHFGQNTKVSYFYVSKTDFTKMLFVDKENKIIYISKDELTQHETAALPASSDHIVMHPYNSDWLLLYDYNERKLCSRGGDDIVRQEWLNKNLAQSGYCYACRWQPLVTVHLSGLVELACYWHLNKRGDHDFENEATVHLEIQQQAWQHAFYKKCILQKINLSCQEANDTISSSLGPFVSRSLLVIKEYIFVQKSHADGSDNHMMVSYNRSTFKHALFPEEIKTRDFIVVDALEGQVFLAVSHSGVGSASLYLSDPTGRFYSLSLPNIHHRATADWFEVDLHQVEGLPATYLANQQLNTSLSEGKKVRTYISADKGGSWSLLKTPENAPCPKKDDCSLVLRLDMGNYNQDWILSHEEAPGLVIAHGQFSQHYDIDPKTLSVFTSKDGGWNWTMAPFKGIFRFNILDQGGILTAIIDRDYNVTNNVHYSYDYGKTWLNETFSNDKLMVDGVINEPNINTLLVSIYGHRSRSSPWIMVQLNFSAMFSRKCNASDYAQWTPSDHDNSTGEQCVLGLEMQYQRRRDDAVCFNGEDYQRPVQKATCSCTLEDFECDFGYKKSLRNKCIKEDWLDDSYLAMDCALGNFINKTKGYRKVGSDKCVGGIEKTPDFIPLNISCPLWAPYKLHLIPNITVAATNSPVSFHLTQARGSKSNTSYHWNFGDSIMVNIGGFESAAHQVHQFSTPGIYVVNVTGINSNGNSTSENVAIHVEKPIRELTLFSASEIKKGYLFTVIVATDVDHTSAFDSLHYVWRFGDEKEEESGRLTWEPQARHVYNSTGDYVITVFAANIVSTKSQQFNIKVYGNGSIVRLSFSENINKVFAYHNFSAVITYQLLDILRRGIAMVVGVDYNRLSIFLYSYNPLKVDLMVVAPADPSDISIKQIVATVQDMVKNGTLVVNEPFFNALGSFVVVSAVDIEGDVSHNVDPPKVPNYRAVYIALPVVILTALVTVLVLMYYRSRFRSMRHYSVLNQREDTDALLDDEDEPPLDLRSDGRNEHFSRDDSMLDLGTGSHLVMVTGSGGGDSAENC